MLRFRYRLSKIAESLPSMKSCTLKSGRSMQRFPKVA